jgi:chemotaxis protein MotB
MPRKKRQDSGDEDAGAPEWMVTFSDCMTLLLTFFVLLLSFSSFDDKVFPKMESAFTEGLSSIGLPRRKQNEALQSTPRVQHQQEPEEGSEKPTPEGQYESNPSSSLDFMSFQDQKVFLIPSDKIFLGRGSQMSGHGRQMLTDVGTLLKAVPNRVVVTEHALEDGDARGNVGLTRAWIVTRFLTDQRGLDKGRFSISSAGTTDADAVRQSGLIAANSKSTRVLEIVILERSTYN